MAESEQLARFVRPFLHYSRKMELELTCPSCFVVLRQPKWFACAHVVCSQCIVVKDGDEYECPVCLATCPYIRHVMLIEKMVDIFKSLDNAIASGVQKLCPRLLADHNNVDGHVQGSEVDKSSQNNTEGKLDDSIFGMMRKLLRPLLHYSRKMELELTCPSCFVVLRQPKWFACAHVVCSQCIVAKDGDEYECPVCLATCLRGDIRPIMLIEKMVDIFKSLDNAIASGVQKLCPRLLADHNSVDGHVQGSEVDRSSQNNTGEKFDDGIFDMHEMMRKLPAKANPLSGNSHTKEEEEEEHVSNVFGRHQNNLQSHPHVPGFVTKRMLVDGGSVEPSTFGRKTCTHNAGKDADIDPVQPSTPSSLHDFTERRTNDGKRSGISASSTPSSTTFGATGGSANSSSLFAGDPFPSSAASAFGANGVSAFGNQSTQSGTGASQLLQGSTSQLGSCSPSPSLCLGSSSAGSFGSLPSGSIASGANPFSQNPSPFQRAGNVGFSLGESFSLGSGVGYKSSGKLARVFRDKARRK